MMSLRNIRKVYGRMEVPPPEDGPDNVYEPAYTQKFTKNIYAGLEVSSDSENNDVVAEESAPEEPKPVEKGKKKQKQKKKKQRKFSKNDELDEIDRSLKEVNEMLGEPEEIHEVQPIIDLEKIKKKLFTVNQHFMDPNEELNKKFGPDEDEPIKKRGRRPNLRRITYKGSIIANDKNYKKKGLFMTRVEQEDMKLYYFQHNRKYQEMHTVFLYSQNENLMADSPNLVFPIEESPEKLHVEGMLEVADRLYMLEEYAAGNAVITDIICYMQKCAHTFFSVTDIETRLPYHFVENRAFHIALMKYMHMLTNKACHRTALEVSKILLNLDPTDPLAVIFMVDIIAVRAEEHQWLIGAFDYWKEDREAGFLFNLQYSYALANYHVALKKKQKDPHYAKPTKASIHEPVQMMLAKLVHAKYRRVNKNKGKILPEDDKVGFEEADKLIQEAMLKFPYVLICIFQNSGNRNEKMKASELFQGEIVNGMSKNLKDLIFLYARLIWNKFTEEPVLKWIMRNVEELVDKFAVDEELRAEALAHSNVNMNLFQVFPVEIKRHLSILSPLSNLISDGAVPDVGKLVSYDPFPPAKGFNHYQAILQNEEGVDFYEALASILPGHDHDEENSSQLSELELQASGSSDHHHSTSLNSRANNEETSETNTVSMDVSDNEDDDLIIASIPIQNPIEFIHELSDCIDAAVLTRQGIAIGISMINYESILLGNPEPVSCFAVLESSMDENNDACIQQDEYNQNDVNKMEDGKNNSDNPVDMESNDKSDKLVPAITIIDDWLDVIKYEPNTFVAYSKIVKCSCTTTSCFCYLYFMVELVAIYKLVVDQESQARYDEPLTYFDIEEDYEDVDDGESGNNGNDGDDSDDDEENENECDAEEHEAQNDNNDKE